jgi:hypothetical protein
MARTIEAKTARGQGLSLYSESALSAPAWMFSGATQQAAL